VPPRHLATLVVVKYQ